MQDSPLANHGKGISHDLLKQWVTLLHLLSNLLEVKMKHELHVRLSHLENRYYTNCSSLGLQVHLGIQIQSYLSGNLMKLQVIKKSLQFPYFCSWTFWMASSVLRAEYLTYLFFYPLKLGPSSRFYRSSRFTLLYKKIWYYTTLSRAL